MALVKWSDYMGSLQTDFFTWHFQFPKFQCYNQFYKHWRSLVPNFPNFSATISAINTGEVWVRRRDGSKTKLYISQLQRGKCTIRHDR